MRQAKVIYAIVLATLLFSRCLSVAQTHVVSAKELRSLVLTTSQQRAHDRETLRLVLSTPEAEKLIKSKGLTPQQIQAAVSLLSDQEIANLTARATGLQNDFAAGGSSEARLIIGIIVAIFAAFIIYAAIHFQPH